MKHLLVIAAALVLSAVPLQAQMSRFLGNWDAVTERDQVTRVLITMGGTTIHVHLWGRCVPRFCDWGEQPGAAFSERVSTDPFDGAVAILADFVVPQERSRVVLRMAGEDRLEVEVFTQFTDGSGRNSYRLRNLLQRSPDLQAMAGQRLSTLIHKYVDVFALSSATVSTIFTLRKEVEMPRRSPFPILLSDGEREQLEAMARTYTAPYFAVVRAKLILLAADGLENQVIGERLGLPRQVVSKWRKRFYAHRLEGLSDHPRSGRPAGFSPSRGRAGKGARL